MLETPQIKAKILYDHFCFILNIRDMRPDNNPFAKECALFCAEECRKTAFMSEDWVKYWGAVIETLNGY
jgi:hypothetical protein